MKILVLKYWLPRRYNVRSHFGDMGLAKDKICTTFYLAIVYFNYDVISVRDISLSSFIKTSLAGNSVLQFGKTDVDKFT